MAWKAILTASAEHDIEAINEFLFQTQHHEFGHDIASADQLARIRVRRIIDNIHRITNTPHVGAPIKTRTRLFRRVTFDRTTYWYSTDDALETVQFYAIFTEGQDHFSRFMNRLTENGEAG
ncbi:hypothetical protein AB2B41_18350 [Marimonas sp. MJW-29]|uniref:Type II toxin-antitoxin system RelE/ParE family toxin n=1 Tax=Sulfitobacter sediminis TaxID=3234186 RepID=A0ABV3RRE3_9RHOB